MKTLDSIKQEYARENNFCEWSEILYSIDDPAEIEEHFDKVAKMYALEACKEALKNASENTTLWCETNILGSGVEMGEYNRLLKDEQGNAFDVEKVTPFKQSILSEDNIPKKLL